MSQTIYSGQSRDLAVPVGQAIGVFVTKGAYSLSIKAGPGRGNSLASSATASQTYGPWASNVIVTLRCEVGGECDFDIGVTPLDDRETPVFKTGAAGLPYLAGGVGIGASGGPLIKSGTGTPEGAVTAPVGSLFLRSDGGVSTTLYVKQSGTGNTGWVAK